MLCLPSAPAGAAQARLPEVGQPPVAGEPGKRSPAVPRACRFDLPGSAGRDPTPAPAGLGRLGDEGAGDGGSAAPPPAAGQVPPAGSGGDGSVLPCGGAVLCAGEVEAIVAAAAGALGAPTMTVAVADRAGNVLAVFRKPAAAAGDADIAVGLARTAAFFSNDKAPLSSRTVRFLSGINFPPGIADTASGGLYGIENSNRGCALDVAFNPGLAVAPSRSLAGISLDLPCNAFDAAGCGSGIVTGKPDVFDSDAAAVNPGGVPIFRPAGAAGPAVLLGGIGVSGVPAAHAEFAAFSGAFGAGATLPVPSLPLPPPGNVFIDGIRLPFVEQVERPAGTSAGVPAGAYDPFFPPGDGAPAPVGYLVGPQAGSALSLADVERIIGQAIAGADRTRAAVRLPPGQRARMVITVADLDGSVLALYRMADALFDAVDVTPSKARTVVALSGAGSTALPGVPAGVAMTTRAIGFAAQPLFPSGITGSGPGPFFELYRADRDDFCSLGNRPPGAHQNGVTFFPGGVPLYRDGVLAGGLGVSGDGVDQDDYVAFLGAEGFLPPPALRSDRVVLEGVRLPFLKFPRNPEE